MFPDKKHIVTHLINDDLFVKKNITVSVLRLDKLHPIVSGNKLFKLRYFLEAALSSGHKQIITFGGAYSNHLVATAFACRENNLQCIGIVRGEKPAILSHTLQQCLGYGMQLKFVSRIDYSKKEEPAFLQELSKSFGEHLLIPEGGYHPTGVKGAMNIIKLLPPGQTHICCAVGTATTVAGLLSAADETQLIYGIAALKNMEDLNARLNYLCGNLHIKNFVAVNEYSFNGYAKYDDALIKFMNKLYKEQQLPTDFVYTAKLMYAVYDMLLKDRFASGSKITCIHTGGLQGNLSLPANSLVF